MKRGLLKLGVFVLLGTIVNVVAAWGFVYNDFNRLADSVRSADEGDVSPIRGTGWGERPHYQFEVRDWHYRAHRHRLLCTAIPNELELVVFEQVEAGWPFPALIGHSILPYTSAPPTVAELTNARVSMHWAMPVKTSFVSASGRVIPQVRLFPLQPIWRGFIVNSMMYAVALWVLWLAVGKGRSSLVWCMRNVRHHRCPACGFIIAPRTCANGLCSECGAKLPLSLVRERGQGSGWEMTEVSRRLDNPHPRPLPSKGEGISRSHPTHSMHRHCCAAPCGWRSA